MPEPLHFRYAREDEIPAIGRLAAHSFPGPTRTPGWWEDQLREPRYGGGVQFVGETGGRLVATLQLHRMWQYIAGAAFPCAGVGTVAISPVDRRRRHAAELMRAGLRAARDRGDLVSALYPFRSSFYRRLGYGEAGAALQWQVPPGSLPDASERHAVILLESASDRREAAALYERWAVTQTGQMQRNERVWSYLWAQPDRALVGYRAGGQLEGYAFVAYHPELPRRDRFLEVNELVWTTTASRRALYGWLASLGDQWEQLLIRTLPAHRFSDWLREPRLPADAAPAWGLWAPAATLLMGPMFRLLDVDAAWSARRVEPAAALTVALDVVDATLPENGGHRRLAFEGGRAVAERDGHAELTLRLDVSTLSRLFIGALPATAGVAAGLIECDRPERLPALDAALALPEPWTFDRF